MFNKYKKKILLILTLVFVFNFAFSYKRVEASVLVASGVALSVVLLVGAGVAITSPQMAQDLGSKLWGTLKDVAEIPSKIGDFFKVKITESIIKATGSWISDGNIPTSPTENIITENITLPYTTKFEYPTKFELTFPAVEAAVGKSFTLDFYFDNKKMSYAPYSYTDSNVNLPVNQVNISVNQSDVTNNKIHFDSTFISDGVFLDSTGQAIIFKGEMPNEFKLDIKELQGLPATVGNITTIPYTPEVSAGASKDKLTTSLPVGSTVTYPKDLVKDFPATTDKPIQNVTDIPDVKVDAPATDVPGTDVGVIEGLLQNIISGINSIVNFFVNFFVPVDGTLPPLDFTPLYFPLVGKFPFCIPFDLINTFKEMVSSRQAPKFTVTFPKNIFPGGGSFTIDFREFNGLIVILRYIILLYFCIALILLTKKLIN